MARYALVVGIAKYDNFRHLDKAATDAAAIARILQTHGQYQVEPLPKRLVESENRWELAPDKKVTGKELGQVLETFLLERAKGQEALIYFAGHGFEVPGLGSKKKGYLATSDGTSDGRNAILFSDLNDLIRESRLSSLVLIVDCCHAGSFLERTLLESTLTAFKEKQDYYLMTACRSFERAREGEAHGVFTAAVLQGLQANNADSEGAVTGDRLFDFIQRELRQSGQEPIRTGTGRSITLVNYQPQEQTVTAIVDEQGEVVCPYQGLQAFTAAQREFFFGRKRIVEAIKQNLEQQTFVPVIGASGSGKSSVVRAGLMPWLEESGWRILEPIKPGFEPLASLRGVFEPFFKRSRSEIQALHQLVHHDSVGLAGVMERIPGNERYVLIVDQFEELFTVCASESDRQRFIELITQVATVSNARLAVVTTMRADFLEPCLHYPALHYLIQAQTVFMPPLTGIDLRDAITEPAKRQGYIVEDALLLQILEDVGKEPGFLPLLEFALTKLWEKRDTENYLLTLKQYEKLGGLIGSLNLHAERVYHYQDYEVELPSEARDPQEQEWIKHIFLMLVRTGDGERDTRQRQPKARLLAISGDTSEAREVLNDLLEELVQGRLLVVGKEGLNTNWIDLAHEALIDGWKQFVEWRSLDRDLRKLLDRLRDALRQWQNSLCDNEVMMGGLLVQVRENWEFLEPQLDKIEREFYWRSIAYEQNRIADLEQALAQAQQRQVEVEKTEIKALCKSSEALRALDQEFDALLESLRAAAKLKHVAWLNTDPQIQAQVTTTLQQSLYWIREQNRIEGHEDILWSITFSPDGQIIASGSRDRKIKLWSQNGTLLKTLEGHRSGILSVRFSPDGTTLASGSRDQTIKLWSRDGILLKTLEGHSDCVTSLSFSHENQVIASASDDKTVKLWSIDGTLLKTLEGHDGRVLSVCFSPDGQIIASGSEDKTIRLWNLIDAAPLKTFEGHDRDVLSVNFSPDGQTIVSGSADDTIRLWDLDGILINTIQAHDGYVTDASFSPDGQMIVSSGWDNTVRLWSREGKLLKTLIGHSGKVVGTSFSPDSQSVVSASADRTVKLWSSRSKNILEHGGEVHGLDFSPDGKLIASSGLDKVVKLWDNNGNLIRTFRGHNESVWSVNFSPDGCTIASASFDETVKLWSLDGTLINTILTGGETWNSSFHPFDRIIASACNHDIKIWNLDGTLVRTIKGHDAPVTNVCFSPNGKLLASASKDLTVRLWNLEGTLLATLTNYGWVWGLSFSPDSTLVASSGGDHLIKIWSIDGTLLKVLEGHGSVIQSVSFDPTSTMIVSASGDGTVRVWSVDGHLLRTLRNHNCWVRRAIFSSGGKTIASAGNDGRIVLWALESSLTSLMQYGCAWVKDYLQTNPNVEETDRHLCDGVCE